MTSPADAPNRALRTWHWPDSVDKMRDGFLSARPYPHIVIDDVFAPELLARLYDEIPPPADPLWTRWGGGKPEDCSPQNTKRGISDISKLSPSISWVLEQLMDAAFVEDLCAITGAKDLVTDRTLSGGGLHCSGRGAALRLHADPIRHPSPAEFDQALNLILYISPHWTAAYDGQLELWSRDCSQRVVSIPPLFNRMVIFQADRTTYHGHPRPNCCPDGIWRASLALYYYIRRPHRVELESNRPVWR
jgi:2-oxoglutarate-Fe(II)-dependent oxygenase superfamily protein